MWIELNSLEYLKELLQEMRYLDKNKKNLKKSDRGF